MIGGAHMGELRRTEAGIFDESTIVSLYDFEKAVEAWNGGDDSLLREMIVPAEDAIRKVLSVVEVDKSALGSLYVGRPLLKSNVVGGVDVEDGEVFALFCEYVFVGVYKRGKERSVFARAEFVFTNI
jgi:tRNA pseudouridine55 synthase